MKLPEILSRRMCCIDIGLSSLKVLIGEAGLEVPLERSSAGSLTEQSVDAAGRELRAFLESGGGARRALCALPARGVSLRQLHLPPATREETGKLVALQLEREFPLPPGEIVWGYARPGANGHAAAHPSQGVTIAAMRRDGLEEYRRLLAAAGLTPTFTLGVLAGAALLARPPESYTVLDIGKTHSELLHFENGRPHGVRSVPWGGETVTQALAAALGIGRDDAEAFKCSLGHAVDQGGAEAKAEAARPAVRQAIGELARLLHRSGGSVQAALSPGGSAAPGGGAGAGGWPQGNGAGSARRFYLLGGGSKLAGLAEELGTELGRLDRGAAVCEVVQTNTGPARSAANLGLLLESARTGNRWLRFLASETVDERKGRRVRGPGLWQAAAILLLGAVLFSYRYLEPILRTPGLESRLAAARAVRDSLPRHDRELGFLEEIEARRAPYLDVVALIGQSAPPGTILEFFSMNGRGEISLKGSLGSGADASSLRSRLVASKRFKLVVIEEQNPTKDKKRVDFRLTAQLAPPGSSPAPASSEASPKTPPPNAAAPALPEVTPPVAAPPAAAVGSPATPAGAAEAGSANASIEAESRAKAASNETLQEKK